MDQKALVILDVSVRISFRIFEHGPQALEVVVHHMRQPEFPGARPLALFPTAGGAEVHVLLGDTQGEEAHGAHETHDPRLGLFAVVHAIPFASIRAIYDE